MAWITDPRANHGQIRGKIKAEIQGNASRYGAGNSKTAVERAYLLNVPQSDPDSLPTLPPRIFEILVGEAYAPNAVDDDDVTAALV